MDEIKEEDVDPLPFEKEPTYEEYYKVKYKLERWIANKLSSALFEIEDILQRWDNWELQDIKEKLEKIYEDMMDFLEKEYTSPYLVRTPKGVHRE